MTMKLFYSSFNLWVFIELNNCVYIFNYALNRSVVVHLCYRQRSNGGVS